MAKPKTRIPDINDEAIDPNDHIDFEEEDADLDEEDITSAVEQKPTLESQRGMVWPVDQKLKKKFQSK